MMVFKISFCGVLLIAVSSCRSFSDKPGAFQQPLGNQPVVQRLNFTDTKIDLSMIAPVKAHPVIKKILFHRSAPQSYDTSDYKPFSHPVEEIKFNYHSLPSKKLNVFSLPSKPLTFKTILLPQPVFFKAGRPQLKKGLLFELGGNQDFPATNITCLLIDRDGFLWIATDQGLYRYDGENFLLFIKGPFGHLIFSMVQDQQGEIWMGTENGGLQVFNPIKGLLSAATTKEGLSNNNIARMLLVDKQNLWVTTFGGGVDIIDTKNKSVKVLDKSNGLSDNSCVGITKDYNNNIWVATISGLNIINLNNSQVKYLTTLQSLKSDVLSSVICDGKGRIWVADFSGGGLSVIDPGENKIVYITELKTDGEATWSMLKDGNGRVWTGTIYHGVQIFDLEKRMTKQINIKKSSSNEKDEGVENMIQDNSGQTWIASRSGLNLLKLPGSAYKHIGKDIVSALYEDPQGLIWHGSTGSGINLINRKTKTIEHLGKINGLSNDTIQSINGGNGNVYICTNDGLDIVGALRRTIIHLGTSNGLTDKIINKAIVDRDGKVWIAGRRGLDIYNPRDKTIVHTRKVLCSDNDCYITDIAPDKSGNVWISQPWAGVFKIDEKKRVEHLDNVPPSKRKDNHLLLVDKKGNVWIGADRGIFIADRDSKTSTFIAKANGLIKGDIISLLQYKNRVFAGTDQGISVITPPFKGAAVQQKWEIESFGKGYRLVKADNDNYYADLICSDGTYCRGDNGITLYDFSHKDTIKHTTYISQINVMDQARYFADRSRQGIAEADTILNNGLADINRNSGAKNIDIEEENGLLWNGISGPFNMPVNLHLTHDLNYLRFDFTSSNLAKNDSTWYRYMLEGADKKWTLTTAPASGNYFSLAPGKYTFKVNSKSLNGVWGKPDELTFIIAPPWWQTWWAIAAMASFASLVIFGLSRIYYINLLSLEKAEFEKKLAIERERQRISSDMHDDIGASLSAIKLYTGNLQKTGDVNAGITDVYAMINELSYKIREVIWSLNKVYDTLESLIYFIELTTAQMFENTGIRLKIIIPEDIPEIKISSEKRRDVLLIVKEAMHNIIKHAHASAAVLQFGVNDNYLIIKIKDNGTGMPLKNKSNGQGLINMKKRAENLDGDISFETDGGTVINLKVPF